jgi:hypothetical protein
MHDDARRHDDVKKKKNRQFLLGEFSGSLHSPSRQGAETETS